MTNDALPYPEIEGPSGKDDFKAIHGVGPGIEKRLHRAGIRTYEQLAVQTPEAIGAMLADMIGITAERVREQDWIGQAQKLAASRASVNRSPDDASANGRQHYASFTMELLLDEGNAVRRTRVAHVQTGHSDIWPGWDASRLMGFFIQRAHAKIAAAEPSARRYPELSDLPAEHAGSAALAAPEPTPRIGGELRVRELSACPYGGNLPRSLWGHDQPFRVRLALDLSTVLLPPDVTAECAAKVRAKSLSGRGWLVVGEVKSTLVAPTSDAILTVDATRLEPDVYRLHADVTISAAPMPGSLPSSLACSYQGPLVSVY